MFIPRCEIHGQFCVSERLAIENIYTYRNSVLLACNMSEAFRVWKVLVDVSVSYLKAGMLLISDKGAFRMPCIDHAKVYIYLTNHMCK